MPEDWTSSYVGHCKQRLFQPAPKIPARDPISFTKRRVDCDEGCMIASETTCLKSFVEACCSDEFGDGADSVSVSCSGRKGLDSRIA